MKPSILIAMALACSPSLASAKSPTVAISDWNKGLAGPQTEVMVLGTVHLSGLPKDFRVERLDPLIDRLAAFKSDVITIEALSGPDCDMLARYEPVIQERPMTIARTPTRRERQPGSMCRRR